MTLVDCDTQLDVDDLQTPSQSETSVNESSDSQSSDNNIRVVLKLPQRLESRNDKISNY